MSQRISYCSVRRRLTLWDRSKHPWRSPLKDCLINREIRCWISVLQSPRQLGPGKEFYWMLGVIRVFAATDLIDASRGKEL
jgi:hypothetical protein